jgi:ABC-type anion transport system duplicated permease subunit
MEETGSTEGAEGAQPNPLAAERQRLRAQGYTDAEISQILVARALGGGAGPTGAPLHPQGMFSNVLSSIVAVAGYAGGLFTTIRHDITTILDRSAPAGARTSAFVAIAVKAVVIGALTFAAWQEWQQHIISSTEIAESQARKLKAEADAAKVLNEAQAKKLQAEADAAKALNEAQVKKLESEAAVAKELNEAQTRKTRAEECSARMKAAIDQGCSVLMLSGAF